MKKIRYIPKHGDYRVIRKFVLRKTLPPVDDVGYTETNFPVITRTFENTYIHQIYDSDSRKWFHSHWADINVSEVLNRGSIYG